MILNKATLGILSIPYEHKENLQVNFCALSGCLLKFTIYLLSFVDFYRVENVFRMLMSFNREDDMEQKDLWNVIH